MSSSMLANSAPLFATSTVPGSGFSQPLFGQLPSAASPGGVTAVSLSDSESGDEGVGVCTDGKASAKRHEGTVQ